MNEPSNRSARILIDLQACQTQGSAHRGVGRYSQALFNGISTRRRDRDIFALTSDMLPFKADVGFIPDSRVLRLPELPEWPTTRGFQQGERDSLDALAYSTYISPLKADVIHVSHVFEGCGDRVPLPSPTCRSPGQIYSATLYDLIPLLYQDHYFQDDNNAKWYYSRTSWLQQADLLFAISECSRKDAIELLGIAPSRIVTIRGGIASHFKPASNSAEDRRRLTAKYGLAERIVVYTGGDDHRKNIAGAIAGFAEVPSEERKDVQLVIVCSMHENRKLMYLDVAKSCGLSDSDVQITGFVTEADLIGFYQVCDAFIFPSLYEGLGLPVLEAMACGAPVIAGNNSSLREIIVREDALFEATSPKSIAESIVRVLKDDNFSRELREFGLRRVRDFTWEKSSEMAIEALDEAMRQARESGVRAAVQGWVSRKRLAMLTPLPPDRSGIADYNVKFLPFLAKHFDIDLFVRDTTVTDISIDAAFRIFDVSKFETVALSYDVILYELGNSEFHDHMLPLLDRFPGIVGLHDAYLSGLIRYLEFHNGDVGRYSKEMLTAHGPLANRYISPLTRQAESDEKMEVELPCTKHVLDSAIGLISHSQFNLDLARRFYPEGWQAPYRIVPQMVVLSPKWSERQKREARALLGYRENDLIVATFGRIANTKCGDRILEAVLTSSQLRDNQRVHLVFAGELPNDDFCRRLKESIESASISDRIKITGFLDEESYERYVHVADVAVQLRIRSRGGTPKGVLDCLSAGLPVIVNQDASYLDYPNAVVVKLDPDPLPCEIGAQLDRLLFDSSLRESVAIAGIEYVREKHDPVVCAAQYASAIHEFLARDDASKLRPTLAKFLPHLAACSDRGTAVDMSMQWLRKIESPAFAKRRLIFDVSHIARSDHQTGIPRVVKNITKSLYCSNMTGFDPIAVELIDGELRIASHWLLSQGVISSQAAEWQPPAEPVRLRRGDVLLMLDSSWVRYREFYPVFEAARRVSVPIYTVIYDLLPLSLPPGNIVEGGREWFEGWIRDCLTSSDGVVCISKSASVEVASYLANTPEVKASPKIGYWHLGSDSPTKYESTASMLHLEAIGQPYLLMVGTIEPRKNHELAFAAMKHLWERGRELNLVIAGKKGWMVDQFMDRLRSSPELGTRLFLVEGPTDSEIGFLYKHASGLLFLSKGEGFGLPLVEAANYGVPIICSDIPVFHEIAGDFATYVTLRSAESVADDLDNWWIRRNSGNLPNTGEMPRLSWDESAAALLRVVMNDNWIRGT